jgi:hypothetical protein
MKEVSAGLCTTVQVCDARKAEQRTKAGNKKCLIN